MNPSMNPGQPAGIPCPNCKTLIEFKIDELLRRTHFRCKSCSLELTLNRHQSRQSLEALGKLQGAIETLNAVKKQYGGAGHGQG